MALPLGELSPQVTERALRRLLNNHVHLNPQRWPSQSRLCRASSPKGRAKGTFLRIRPLFPQCFMLYRIPSSGSPRRASFPQGKLLFRVGRHTVLFLRHDNRNAPGTAHRPFPTVSLIGVFSTQRISKTGTSVAQKTVNCQLKNNCQLSIVNCQFPRRPLRWSFPFSTPPTKRAEVGFVRKPRV